jgi:hypothetical protein
MTDSEKDLEKTPRREELSQEERKKMEELENEVTSPSIDVDNEPPPWTPPDSEEGGP